jgi:hypothetical protein
MPYLNDKIYTPQDLGIDWGDTASGVANVALDIYKTRQQKGLNKQQIELAKINAQSAALALQAQQAQQRGGGAGGAGDFLKKHGLKLAIGAGGLVVLFIVIKKMKK